MGFVVGSKCYADAAGAMSAYYSAIPVTTFMGSDGMVHKLYHYRYSPDGVTWMERHSRFQPGAGIGVEDVIEEHFATGASTLFLSCDYSAPFMDGMAIGWMIAAALLAAASLKLIRRGA